MKSGVECEYRKLSASDLSTMLFKGKNKQINILIFIYSFLYLDLWIDSFMNLQKQKQIEEEETSDRSANSSLENR